MSFDWNKKRTIQMLTPNKIIQNVSLSPKEVILAGGNRIDQHQVLASICVVLKELIEIQEASAARLESMLNNVQIKGTVNAAPAIVDESGTEPT